MRRPTRSCRSPSSRVNRPSVTSWSTDSQFVVATTFNAAVNAGLLRAGKIGGESSAAPERSTVASITQARTIAMDADASRESAPPSSAHHGYFVLQLTTSAEGDYPGVFGVLEDLTTGGRLSFASAADLARTLEAWAGEVTRPRVLVAPATLSTGDAP